MTGPALSVAGVEVSVGGTLVLPEVSLDVRDGEVLALMGPSGSGKTTLLDCIMGLRQPSHGTISVHGHDLWSMGARQRSDLRRTSMGIVTQQPQLLPELSVLENVAVPLLFGGRSRRRALARAEESLASVGMAGAEQLRPENLSGGEAQRVALARALVSSSARVLVADEPTAALDEANVDLLVQTLLRTVRERGMAVILATHDPAVAQRCDRTQRLRDHRAHVAAL